MTRFPSNHLNTCASTLTGGFTSSATIDIGVTLINGQKEEKMPSGNTPPDLGIPQADFDALHAMVYDVTNEAFKSGSTLYWFGVERKSGATDCCEWFHGTDSEIGENPKALVTVGTYNVVKNGTRNSNGSIAYNNNTYWIRLKRNTQNGKQYGIPIQV